MQKMLQSRCVVNPYAYMNLVCHGEMMYKVYDLNESRTNYTRDETDCQFTMVMYYISVENPRFFKVIEY